MLGTILEQGALNAQMSCAAHLGQAYKYWPGASPNKGRLEDAGRAHQAAEAGIR